MLILTRRDVQAALRMNDALRAAEAGLAAYSAGEADVPLRANIGTAAGVNLYMPGLLRGSGALGAKLVSIHPGNVSIGLPTVLAVMVLQDATSGAPLAVMEASYLTAVRTGAAAGVATSYLAREDAAKVLLIGGGAQGRTQVQGVRAVRKVSHLVVCDLNRATAEAAASEIAADEVPGGGDLSVTISDDSDAWVAWADIIICATTSRRPVFKGELVRPGTHINAIGAYTPEMQELPPEVLVRADRVVCDARAAAWQEAGDLVIPFRRGLIDSNRVDAELGDLVLGRSPGRVRPEQITIYKGVGLAALDLAAAQATYVKALELGLGSEIELLAQA